MYGAAFFTFYSTPFLPVVTCILQVIYVSLKNNF